MDWLRTRAGVEGGKVLHRSLGATGGTAARVLIDWTGSHEEDQPLIPWQQLGYHRARSAARYWAVHAPSPLFPDLPPTGELLLIFLGYLQVGFLLVGLVRGGGIAGAAANATARRRAVLPAALGVALGLGVLFWLYVQAVRYFLGPGPAVPEYLQCIPSIGWNLSTGTEAGLWRNVQPCWAQLVAGVCVILLGPLAQEIFFRGGLLSMWTAADRFGVGASLSALAAAALVLDWTVFPVAFAAGLALAWLYHWSRSLLASLLAHIAPTRSSSVRSSA